jgi:hypothetical protein
MLDHRISGLPVLDGNGKVAGMLTEGDLTAPRQEPTASDHVGSNYCWARAGSPMNKSGPPGGRLARS